MKKIGIWDNVKDDFDESLSPGGDVRFEFMQTGRASIALLDSFMELLVEFNGEIE